jgi:hypothetical protein
VNVSPASSSMELAASLGATATLEVPVPATVEVLMVLITVCACREIQEMNNKRKSKNARPAMFIGLKYDINLLACI